MLEAMAGLEIVRRPHSIIGFLYIADYTLNILYLARLLKIAIMTIRRQRPAVQYRIFRDTVTVDYTLTT